MAFLVLLFLLIPVLCSAQSAPFDALIGTRAKDRIVTIGASQRIMRSGNTHPAARPELDQGPVPPDYQMEGLTLVLRSDPDQQAALEQLQAGQQNPQSPLYHHWLTPETFGAHFGASERDLAVVTGWLQGHGFQVDPPPAGRLSLTFSGTARSIEAAFHTQIHAYLVNGVLHHANATNPEIPAGLADVVDGPASLNDFRPKPQHARVDRSIESPGLGCCGSYNLAPADLLTIYNVNPLRQGAAYTGSGISIAIVGLSYIQISDVTQFQNQFNLFAAGGSFGQDWVGSNPGVNCANEAQRCEEDWDEATLDVEWATALAPGAAITLVAGAPDNSNGLQNSASYIVNTLKPNIISMSYGDCEKSLGSTGNSYWQNLWAQAQSNGISVFVASGDAGADGCDLGNPDNDLVAADSNTGLAVNGLCSVPSVVCVGGTEFNEASDPNGVFWSASGTALGYIPEMVWNESGNISPGGACPSTQVNGATEYSPNGHCGRWASGGGKSAIYTKPAWQQNITPADGSRDVPDVALTAAGHDSYVAYVNGARGYWLGTSLSTPSFAGIMALLEQSLGGERLGNPLSTFYQLGSLTPSVSNEAPSSFHTTGSGNNSVPGVTGYSASPFTAYNQATGLGSVDAAFLVQSWPGTSYQPTLQLSVSPTTLVIQPGSTGQFSLDVRIGGGFDSPVSLGPCSGELPALPVGFSSLTGTLSSIPAPGGALIQYTLTPSQYAYPGYAASITLYACGQRIQASATLNVSIAGYSLSISASPFGSGTVTATPSSSNGTYAPGAKVCLTASPNAAWEFTSWTAPVALDSSRCFSMDGNYSVIADFSLTFTFFVTQLYLDLLGREPDSPGLQAWVNTLNAGTPSAQVAYDFLTSSEFQQSAQFVTSAYIGLLGRDPDFTGWQDWSNAARQGMTPLTLISAFLQSSEFRNNNGNLSDSEFVNLLYTKVLGRPADPTGFEDWYGALESGALTRAQLAYDFLESSEFQGDIRNRSLVDLLYLGFLRRAPDPGGQASWQAALNAGMPPATAVNGFITSAEYLGRFAGI